MGSSTSKESPVQQKVVIQKPKEKDPWDIEEISEYRLNYKDFERKFYEAINGYWDEVFLEGIVTNNGNNDDEEDKDKDKNDDNPYPLQQESKLGNNDKDLTNKVYLVESILAKRINAKT